MGWVRKQFESKDDLTTRTTRDGECTDNEGNDSSLYYTTNVNEFTGWDPSKERRMTLDSWREFELIPRCRQGVKLASLSAALDGRRVWALLDLTSAILIGST